jgi:hypothetical protein
MSARRVRARQGSGSMDWVAAHSGQSSQLLLDGNDRNAQFLPAVDIGVNVSHTDNAYRETDRIWIPLNIAA